MHSNVIITAKKSLPVFILWLKKVEKIGVVSFSILLITAVFGIQPVSPGARSDQGMTQQDSDDFIKFMPRQVIVKFKKDVHVSMTGTIKTNKPSINALGERFDIREIKRLCKAAKYNDSEKISVKGKKVQIPDLSNIYLIEFRDDIDVLEIVDAYKSNPNVEYAEPNYIVYINAIPNDTSFSKQWGLQKIQAEKAWDISKGDSSVLIAIIDSGIDWDHPDLYEKIWINKGEDINGNGIVDPSDFNGVDDDGNKYVDDIMGWDFVALDRNDLGGNDYFGEDYGPEDNDPMDYHGHGSHCAGIAGAKTNNIEGIAGLAWNCKIMALRVGYAVQTARGKEGAIPTSYYVEAIIYATNNGAHVINMSFGSYHHSELAESVMNYAHALGTILVASAGNGDTDKWHYPSGYDNVISVAATDDIDKRWYKSNYGSCVDVAAPGKSIFSTLFDNKYESWSGTSMAAPYVTGLVALIRSNHPDFTSREIKHIIKTTTDPIFVFKYIIAGGDTVYVSDRYIGTGRINAFKALLVDSPHPVFAEITSPKDYEFFNKSIDIMGTATGESYVLEYTLDSRDTSWIEIDSGLSVDNDVLATWNTKPLAAGQYILRLTAKNTGYTVRDIVKVRIDNLLQDGWPQYQSGQVVTSVTIGDFDGIDDLEIISGTYLDGYDIFAWHADGTCLPGWPIHTFPKKYVNAGVLADFDNDGDLELVACTENWYEKSCDLYVLNHEGTLFHPSWPKSFQSCILGSPTIRDIDGDGDLEIIECSNKNELYAWHHDGKIVYGNWPVSMPYTFTYNKIPVPSPCLGDVDGDRDIEIIIGTKEQEIYMFNHDGSVYLNWPVKTMGAITSSATLGDLNNDANLEIVVGDESGRVYVWNPDGILLPGWPKQTGHSIYKSPPALGDIDKDGDLEIVVGSKVGMVFIWQHTGETFSPEWPKQVAGSIFSSPLLGDVDGDEDIEIIVGCNDGLIYGWHHTGEKIDNFPLFTHSRIISTPAMVDMDKDEDIEIVVGTTDWFVYVWDLAGYYDPENIEWGMFQHDMWHTGQYGFEIPKRWEPLIWSGSVSLSSDFFVPENQTLNINPGTTVKVDHLSGQMNEKIKIKVNGTLNAVGTANAPIIFKANSSSNNADQWQGISLENQKTCDEIKYCIIKHAHQGITTFGNWSAFLPDVIENCKLVNCTKGIYLQGWGMNSIVNNDFHHCETAIGCKSARANITGNFIDSVGTGIDLYWFKGEINNNLILDYDNYGMSLEGVDVQIINNVVISRHGTGEGYPIYENTEWYAYQGWGESSVLIKNNILMPVYKASVYRETDSPSTVNVGFNDLAGFSSCVGITDIGGNLTDKDPLFISHEGYTRQDFMLQTESPCIDTGDLEMEDIDGTPCDMGIWGGPRIPPPLFESAQSTPSAEHASEHSKFYDHVDTLFTEKLNWLPNYIGQYNVYRSFNSGGPYRKLNIIPLDQSRYDLTNFLKGYYVVRSVTDTVESYNSREIYILSGTAPSFTNQADTSGTNDTDNGRFAAFGDLNNDKYPDLFVACISGNSKLYQNNQDGTFTEIASTAGVDLNADVAIWGDYNNDGQLDLFTKKLYHNNGNGTFDDITDMTKLNDPSEDWCCVMADYDLDGDTDMYLVRWFEPNVLYKNLGNDHHWVSVHVKGSSSNSSGIGTQIKIKGEGFMQKRQISGGTGAQNACQIRFGLGDMNFIDSLVIRWPSGIKNKLTHISADQILELFEMETNTYVNISEEVLPVNEEQSIGFAIADFDNDLNYDIYVYNNNGENHLYQNTGAPDWTLADITLQAGMQNDGKGAGPAFIDYNNDGFTDLFLANHGPKGLFRNKGDGTFMDVSEQSGLTDISTVTGYTFGDINNDGYLDIYVVNSGQHENPENNLFQNNGPPDWSFTNITLYSDIQAPDYATCAGFWDYNSDGFLDIFVTNDRGSNYIYYNKGNDNHWLQVSLAGNQSNRDGVGARVKVVTDEQVQLRSVALDNPGSHSFSIVPLAFGVGNATIIDSVFVYWPSGIVDILTKVCVDDILQIQEGSSTGITESKSIQPQSFSLLNNYPNPFNLNTNIQYELPQKTRIQLILYNILGQKIRTFVDQEQKAGHYVVQWDGTDKNGKQVTSGIYFYKLVSEEFIQVRKLLLIR